MSDDNSRKENASWSDWRFVRCPYFFLAIQTLDKSVIRSGYSFLIDEQIHFTYSYETYIGLPIKTKMHDCGAKKVGTSDFSQIHWLHIFASLSVRTRLYFFSLLLRTTSLYWQIPVPNRRSYRNWILRQTRHQGY